MRLLAITRVYLDLIAFGNMIFIHCRCVEMMYRHFAMYETASAAAPEYRLDAMLSLLISSLHCSSQSSKKDLCSHLILSNYSFSFSQLFANFSS